VATAIHVIVLTVKFQLKPGDLKPGDLKPGDLKPGDLKPGDLKPGDLKPGDIKLGDFQVEDFLDFSRSIEKINYVLVYTKSKSEVNLPCQEAAIQGVEI
jgi:hypothetical protein